MRRLAVVQRRWRLHVLPGVVLQSRASGLEGELHPQDPARFIEFSLEYALSPPGSAASNKLLPTHCMALRATTCHSGSLILLQPDHGVRELAEPAQRRQATGIGQSDPFVK